jgi:hypothetical protein
LFDGSIEVASGNTTFCNTGALRFDMSTKSLSGPMRFGTQSRGRSRRPIRFPLACETLENRQLLSVAQASVGALGVSNPVVAQTQIAVPTALFVVAPSGFTAVDIEVGTFSGLSQFQINFSGTGLGTAFTFNEGLFFSASLGGDPVFSFFSPSSAQSTQGPFGFGSGNSGLGTSGSGSAGGASAVASQNTAPASAATSITPLNVSPTAGRGSSGGTVVVVIAPQLSLTAIHLAASAAPVTTQPVFSIVAGLDNLPTSFTHFGQYPDTNWPRPFFNAGETEEPATPFIDYVEPFRPAGQEPGPAGEPGRRGDVDPMPVEARIRPSDWLGAAGADRLYDLSAGGLMRGSREDGAARARDRSEGANYSWNLSTVFGTAVIAAGGYHLVMRESDRFSGKAVPRWVGADRPTRRKPRFPWHPGR